ncbi:SDR family NAD(P)-dependent oxidoreductase [Sphingopyxis sp.]|uniref:SDR family NAD(P)-dependent oxidoreductase n=1 Tax=Sphingopyxis sp. TaxID=1908224 RepID=UPI0025EBC9C7|nr:SDR family oxidoreductase [Sphingopyxis sp.]MBR2173826.1 SDR family oxidoreductase [Sphingopyxis sp.]
MSAIAHRSEEHRVGRLEGKRAVVTGAAHGIGRAIAEKFVEEGASVILADIDERAVSEVASNLGQIAVRIDVARKGEIDALFELVEAEWKGLDILVNNAGVTHAAELADLTEEDFDRVLSINLKSALFGTQHAARLMKAGGAIINMSSVNAILAIPNQIPYAVSKGALKQLTNVSAISLAPRNIRVNAIGPGTILTDLARSIMTDKAAENRILSRTPLGRTGRPEEVATIAVFLASDESSYITGQTIYPDGGRMGLNYTVPVPGDS